MKKKALDAKFKQEEERVAKLREKTEKEQRLRIEMEAIKNQEKIIQARRKAKREAYLRVKKLEEIEEERQQSARIKSEKMKVELRKKEIQKNAKVYKKDIKETMTALRKQGKDPTKISITANSNFNEKLVIEHSPERRQSPLERGRASPESQTGKQR